MGSTAELNHIDETRGSTTKHQAQGTQGYHNKTGSNYSKTLELNTGGLTHRGHQNMLKITEHKHIKHNTKTTYEQSQTPRDQIDTGQRCRIADLNTKTQEQLDMGGQEHKHNTDKQ